jgi:cbb3-type cytochrome oxidase maturation protein
MTNLVFLIPVALFLGGLGLGAFLWALRSGQYEDLDGAGERILLDDDRDAAGPLAPSAMHPRAGG